jgi:5-methyltetrahydrofolate--homocysteine methyltransferase
MPIHFTAADWARIRDTYRQWWAGALERPLIHLTVDGATPGRPPAAQPARAFQSMYDATVSAEAMVDAWDYQLSGQRWLGDAFPTVFPNFGPGVIAAFLGATLENGENTVWFHPREEKSVAERRFALDPANPWLRRISDLVRAAGERWGDQVLVGLPDLGGSLDLLASFRPSEQLLLDLYDDPEAVKARTWELHELWWRYYQHFSQLQPPGHPGFSAWTPIYSETPYYMLQCDFSYMIGPEMFNEFVKPELAATCQKLGNAFYHLDGPGELPHLDALLSIPELKGIQWVPGAGQPGIEHWPEVYRKIRDAGKLIQFFTGQSELGLGALDALAGQLGSAKGIIMIGGCTPAEEPAARRLLENYGAVA